MFCINLIYCSFEVWLLGILVLYKLVYMREVQEKSFSIFINNGMFCK